MSLTPEAAAALARLARVSGVKAEPKTLLPAEVILELSGEAVRSRLCTFTDASGAEHCLRPDLTTPIAQMVAMGELASMDDAGDVVRRSFPLTEYQPQDTVHWMEAYERFTRLMKYQAA